MMFSILKVVYVCLLVSGLFIVDTENYESFMLLHDVYVIAWYLVFYQFIADEGIKDD